MTSYLAQTMFPVLAPMASKEKGSVGNRVDCAASQVKNNAIFGLKQAGVAAGVLGASYLAVKQPAAMKTIGTGIKEAATGLANTALGKKVKEYIAKGIEKAGLKGTGNSIKDICNDMFKDVKEYVVKNPKTAAAVAGIAVIGTMVSNYLSHKRAYTSGQIDQKYTDRANVQKLAV